MGQFLKSFLGEPSNSGRGERERGGGGGGGLQVVETVLQKQNSEPYNGSEAARYVPMDVFLLR